MEIPYTDDQYNLRWNNHLANFVHTFVEHQNGESLVDVTLSCEGQYIKAHKLILSACSDYFNSIFLVHNNVSHPFIFLNGVRFVDLKYILHFMYHGEVKVIDKDLPSVLALGETLQIKGLSSVKIRDMPPEQSVQPQPAIIPQNTVKPPYIKTFASQTDKTTFNMSLPPLPSEVPYQIPDVTPNYINNKTEIKVRPESSMKWNHEKLSSPSSKNSSSISDAKLGEPITSKKRALSESPPLLSTFPQESDSPNSNEMRSTTPKTHAFMIFTNEWRKKLLKKHPGKSNKEISIKLGNMWKNLQPDSKNFYYEAAQKSDTQNDKYLRYNVQTNSVKRKAESDPRTTARSLIPIDPLEIVEIQECNTDSE